MKTTKERIIEQINELTPKVGSRASYDSDVKVSESVKNLAIAYACLSIVNIIRRSNE